MTTIVLNQQIEIMSKKSFGFKKVLYVLPFIAALAAYSLGFESVALPVFVAVFFLSIALELGIAGKGNDVGPYSDKKFFEALASKKAFDPVEAKKLLKKHNAEIYRIDSKSHTIQFFINGTKYTMFIKEKS